MQSFVLSTQLYFEHVYNPKNHKIDLILCKDSGTNVSQSC